MFNNGKQTNSIKNVGHENRCHSVSAAKLIGVEAHMRNYICSHLSKQNNLRLLKQIKRAGQVVQIQSITRVSFQVKWSLPPFPALCSCPVILLFLCHLPLVCVGGEAGLTA